MKKAPSLAARVAELEQIVAELRARPPLDHADVAAELHRLALEEAAERAKDPAVQARSFRTRFQGREVGRG